MPIHRTISPNWLKVDKATIFFISFSLRADNLAKVIVDRPKNIITGELEAHPVLRKWRNSKYTPAVTNVEECTNEETGVGAAMAAGSQALKGICALLVKDPAISSAFKTLSTSKNSL